MHIKVASANIAGAARPEDTHQRKFELLATLLGGCDLIGLQEVVKVTDPSNDQVIWDDTTMLKNYPQLSDYRTFFFPHLDSRLHIHAKNWSNKVFQKYDHDGYHIQQGTAILSANKHRCRHLFRDDLAGYGSAQVLPWYITHPTCYKGDRNTEPRSLLMQRFQIDNRSIVFCCSQLTTLTEENPSDGNRQPTRSAVAIRRRQIQWIVDYLSDYKDERKNLSNIDDRVIFVGDFNAKPTADELRPLTTLGLIQVPYAQDGIQYTHRDHRIIIDMIFAPNRIHAQTANIIDLDTYDASEMGRISDHNPVVAELEL